MTFGLIKSGRQLFYRDRLYGQSHPPASFEKRPCIYPDRVPKAVFPQTLPVMRTSPLLTQREIAAQIVAGNGDYVQVAKDNQLRLKQDIEAVLASPPSVGAPLRTAATCAQRHGRREQRPITVRDLHPGDSDWPGAAQVFRLERDIIRLKTGEIRHEAICGVTSCPRARASARRLLTITRRHWVIENRSHYVRDVTFDEDRSQVRTGAIPQSLAALRNTAIALMRLAHVDNIAAAYRRHAAQPAEALALMGVVVRT